MPPIKSAYGLFIQEKRQIVQSEHPDFDQADIRRKLQQMWLDLSDTERARWNAKAKQN